MTFTVWEPFPFPAIYLHAWTSLSVIVNCSLCIHWFILYNCVCCCINIDFACRWIFWMFDRIISVRGLLHITFTGENTLVKSENSGKHNFTITIDFTIGKKLWLKFNQSFSQVKILCNGPQVYMTMRILWYGNRGRPRIFKWGGGGGTKLHTVHIMSKSLTVGGPGSSRVSDALSCYVCLTLKHSDTKQDAKKKLSIKISGMHTCSAHAWIRHCGNDQ